MLIRYGYEITVNCAQPTPMVCLLAVSEDRKADIRVAERVFTTPIIPTTTYLDTSAIDASDWLRLSATSHFGATPRLKTMARSTRRTLPHVKSPSRTCPMTACSF